MAKVMFKKGLRANIPAVKSEGCFYVATDERALYLDVNADTRIRLGDFQEFATLEALQANVNPSKSALYYITSLNVLAKWDGTEYKQINLDTGATSIEVVGEGNAVTAASYDAATRKITLTKGVSYATAEDINTKVGDLGDKDTVRAYVDAKTEGIASSAALAELQEKVGDKSVADQISSAITTLDLANTYDPKGAADAKDTAIAAAKKAGDDAQADVDALETLVGTIPTEAGVETVIAYIDKKAADAATSATYNDTEVRGLITTNKQAIDKLNGTAEQDGSVAKQVADAVATIVADAPAAYDTLKEISDWISGHANDASAMNSQITENKNGLADLKALVGTLPESTAATTVIGYIDAAIEGLKIGDYAKAADLTAAVNRITALEGKSHEHGNKTVLDGITAEKVTAWDAAEQNAKDYIDGLLTWGSF
nr:hypothetical protein [uncultured Ruminococcus sp.]